MNGAVAGADVGGTFTDVVVVDRDGRPRLAKVATTVDDQAEGVVEGIRALLGPAAPRVLAHGTTTATNAVLERKVARSVLVTTEGFRDLLVIGRQDRPSLYDLGVVRPEPLVPSDRVVTVRERTGKDGEAVIDLTEAEVARVVEEVAALEPEAVAVCLLFSYVASRHEELLAAALERRLDVPVTVSSRLLPELREYERASTCVLNAAVAPLMARYLRGLAARLPETPVWVMTSGGGTLGLERAAAAPVHTLLSGPAAGVVAAAAVARSAGFPDAVALDMGGTSTDVCLIRGGSPQPALESEIGGLPFRTPAVAVHTVGAGGGSVAWIDAGGALRVGPRSAGARPGPACYGLGGSEPTVTDAHCALGHLNPARPLGEGAVRLDPAAAVRALAGLPDAAGGAQGVLEVVRATMARALRRVTTERGVSPGDLALVAYGGAGPLHASLLARELGCRTVVVPPTPGVLSALGLLLAPPRFEASRTVMARAAEPPEAVWAELEGAAAAGLAEQGVEGRPELLRAADCRYEGQSHELRVSAGGDLATAFHEAHRLAYGYDMAEEPVQAVTLRVVAIGRAELEAPPAFTPADRRETGRRKIGIAGGELEAAVVDRSSLAPGDRLDGPAVVEQADATTLLVPGDLAEVDQAGNLVVRVDG